MTGPELKQLRQDLGEAVGRDLTSADMAKLIGLTGKTARETYVKWEKGAEPSGPAKTVLSLLAYACETTRIPDAGRFGFPAGPNGDSFYVGRDIYEPVLRHLMRAEILRRLS